MQSNLLISLKKARTDEEVDSLDFKYGSTVIDFPRNIRKAMNRLIESKAESDRKKWFDISKKYTCETFHPKDQLFCVLFRDNETVVYPSINYRRLPDGRLKFKNVGALLRSFEPMPIIDCKTGEEVDSFVLYDEAHADSEEAKAAMVLLKRQWNN